MKSTVEELGLSHATIRVRETDRCASGIVAEAVSDYVNEVRLTHSDSVESGWRSTIIKIPAIVSKEDLALFKKYSEIVQDPDIRVIGRTSWLIVSLRDKALNDVMRMRAIFQKMTSHTATIKYEDFEIYLYPMRALDSIVKSLSAYGEANLLSKRTVPFAELPTFKFDLTVSHVLTEKEIILLQEAFNRGCFDYPRPPEAHFEKMASDLGIGKATLSVQLRQINRKLSTDYLRRFVTPL